MKNQKGITLIVLIIIIVLALVVLVSLFSKSNNKTYTDSSFPTGTGLDTGVQKNKTFGLGDTVIFDGLELTFDSTYSFATVVNQFSEYNARPVIKLGVTVKNISSEKNRLNMFFYDLFGSQGVELDGVSSYFDDSIDFAGDLKQGASYKAYFYILYDGNGNYSIDFDNYSQEISVEFTVNR